MEADGQETTAAGDDEGKPRTASPLGAILRRARERRGLSLERVSEATGKSLHSLLGWEAGITVPRLDSLAMLAGEIGLDLGDLAAAVSPPAPERRRFHRFGDLFQAARQRARLTVAGVAKPVGVSPSAVLAWEEGRRLPQPQWLPRLARRLGLTLGEVDDVLGAAAAPELPESEDQGEDQERTPPRAVTAALGTLLRSRRERRGLTRADVAKQTGIQGRSLEMYEKGLSAPGIENLGRLAWVLDLDLGEFEAVLSPWAAARRRWEHLGLAMRLLRERRGWTREELAERAEVRVDLIRRWEERPAGVSLVTLGPLVESLDVELGELEELFDPELARARRFEGVGPALETARERRGIDGRELARRTGIKLSLISRWERGGVPRVTYFGLAAAALELELGELGSALDAAAAWVRAGRAVGVDGDVLRLTRDLLGDLEVPSLDTERTVGVLLAAARALAGQGVGDG